MSIKTDAIVIRDETATGANTATRVGQNLVDIADDLTAKQVAINLNNAKVGITPTQASDITTNNSKVGVTNEEANPDVVGQAEAESGTSTTERIWTAERVKQAIDALGGGGGGSVDDTAYGVSWNGVTSTAPSKNALYDFIESQVFKVDENSKIIPIFWGGTQAEYNIDFPSGHTSEYFVVVTDGVVPPTTASDIVVDASGFSSNLSATDTDVQTALGTLDALVASGTMTDAEVKIAYENNADTNAFTDDEKVIVGNTSGTNTGDQVIPVSGIDFDPVGTDNSAISFQTEITDVTTVLTSGQKGYTKVFPFSNTSAQTIQVNTGVFVKDDVINVERRGAGSVEFLEGSGIRFRGIRDINNRFYINDKDTMVSLMCRGGDEFSILGNLTRGFTGAVTTTSYSPLTDSGLAEDVTVVGTGFSSNMLDPVLTGNATLNSWTFVNTNQITLNITETGTVGDFITVTYDNGEVFVDTNAIAINAAAFAIESMPNLVEYWKEGVGDNTTGTATKTGVNGKVLSASGEANPTLSGTEWSFNGTNQGFRLQDTEINTLFNQDTKDFQVHVKGTFDADSTRLLFATNVGSTAGQWYFSLLAGGTEFKVAFFDSADDNVNVSVFTGAPKNTEYLMSFKFYQKDLGSGIVNTLDFYLDDGTTVRTLLDVDMSLVNGNVLDTMFIGMNETTSKSFWDVKWKSLVIANTSFDFDNVKTELAI